MSSTDTHRSTPKTAIPRVAGLRIAGSQRTIALDELFPAGGRHAIGRTRQRAIRINDPSVSREHCHITRSARGHYTIHDCASKNGVWIARFAPYDNFVKVTRKRLTVGMHIKLGEVTLIAVDPEGRAPIAARRYSEFLRIAYRIYGSAARAARRLSKRSPSVIADKLQPSSKESHP